MKKNILFVCIENSNRSLMAEAFAKVHGRERVNAYSAGSKPSGVINPKTVAAMKEVGYDLSPHQSKSLHEIPDVIYEYAITMGCGDECPFVKSHHKEDWDIPDPKKMDTESFRKIRDLIEEKVKTLLDKIVEASVLL